MDISSLVATTAISSLISAIIGAVIGALVSKIRVVKKASNDAKESSRKMMEMQEQQLMMVCRLTIYDSHFSIDEKLEAYKIYSAHGWNHQTKTYMDSLVGMDVDEYLVRHPV